MLNREQESKDFDWFVRGVCADFKGSVTSTCRTHKRNEAKGGHPKSKHLIEPPPGEPMWSQEWGWGLAADIVFDESWGRVEACKRIAEHPRYAYKTYPGTKRIHVQGFPRGKLPRDYA